MANPFVHVELNTTDLDKAKMSIIVDPTGAALALWKPRKP
jgi:predicted enzyme related to lactoylglutathione lyase